MIQIYTWSDLNDVRDDLTDDYVLMNDLDKNTAGYNTYASSSANSGAGWNPIGSTAFSGTFDGQGYSIKDIFINRTTTNCGLFLSVSGLVEDLNLLDFNITTTGNQAGGLSGSVNNGTVRRCMFSGKVSAAHYAGGMTGVVAGTASIERCYTICQVSATTSVSGGFTSWAQGSATITDCFSRGSSKCEANVGGFVGYIPDSTTVVINRCYSTASVIHSSSTSDGFTSFQGTGSTVSNCFWDTQTSRQATSKGSATARNTSQMKTIGTFSAYNIISGKDDGYVWGIDSSINYGYPFLQSISGERDHYGARIAASADDGDTSNGWEYTFNWIRFGYLFSGYTSAFRFLSMPMASGFVKSAFLNITYDGGSDMGDDIGPASVRIYGIYEDNTANFTSNPTVRTKTTAYVDWTIEIKESVEQELISPNLSSIIQEIVNRSGWEPENAIGFIIQNNSSSQYFDAYSYDGSSSKAAYLEISYLGISTRMNTFSSIGKIINPERDYGIKIIKPTFDLFTDNDPSHQIYNSDFDTLKYFSSGTVQVDNNENCFASYEVVNHNLDYYPYVEVFVKIPSISENFVYCPAINRGATVTFDYAWELRDDKIIFIIGNGNELEDSAIFKYFIFRNDLGF